MHLKIVSPSKIVFEGEAEAITVPGELGELGILAGHTPLLSTLKKGEVRLRANGHEEKYPISGGFVEVLGDRVVVATREASSEIK